MPSVIEQPAIGYTQGVGPDGPHFVRVFSAIAASATAALDILYTTYTVRKGVVYTDHQGQQYDNLTRCQDISIEEKTPAIVGGEGLFTLVAYFGYSNIRFDPPADVDGTVREYIESAEISEPVDMDRNGVPLTNSSDEPFDPPLTKLTIDRVLVREWIRTGNSRISVEAQYAVYENKVNSTTFRGAPAECFYCKPFVVQEADIPESAAGLPYFRVQARFHFKPTKTIGSTTYGGWVDTPIDKGRRTIAGNVGGVRTYAPIMMGGVPVSEPVLLNGAGQQLQSGATPLVLIVRHYQSIDFNLIV